MLTPALHPSYTQNCLIIPKLHPKIGQSTLKNLLAYIRKPLKSMNFRGFLKKRVNGLEPSTFSL